MLDIRSMEELFSHVDKRASLNNSRVVGHKKSDSLNLFPESQVNRSFVALDSYLKLC